MDVNKFEFDSIKLKNFSPEDQKNILFREIIDERVVKEVRMRDDININATSIITFFTKTIMTELRLYGGQDICTVKLKYSYKINYLMKKLI